MSIISQNSSFLEQASKHLCMHIWRFKFMDCRCWQLRHLPTWKIGWHNILLGNTDMLKPNHHLMLREAGKNLGGIYKIRLAWLQVHFFGANSNSQPIAFFIVKDLYISIVRGSAFDNICPITVAQPITSSLFLLERGASHKQTRQLLGCCLLDADCCAGGC